MANEFSKFDNKNHLIFLYFVLDLVKRLTSLMKFCNYYVDYSESSVGMLNNFSILYVLNKYISFD
jgi:hypothetical protein